MLDKENNAVYNPSYFHAKGGKRKRKTKKIFRRNKKKLRTKTRTSKKQIFSRRN